MMMTTTKNTDSCKSSSSSSELGNGEEKTQLSLFLKEHGRRANFSSILKGTWEMGRPSGFGVDGPGALVLIKWDGNKEALLGNPKLDVEGEEFLIFVFCHFDCTPIVADFNYVEGRKATVGSPGMDSGGASQLTLKYRPLKDGNYFNLECRGGGLFISIQAVENICSSSLVTLNGVPLDTKTGEEDDRGKILEFGDIITISFGGNDPNAKGSLVDLLFKHSSFFEGSDTEEPEWWEDHKVKDLDDDELSALWDEEIEDGQQDWQKTHHSYF